MTPIRVLQIAALVLSACGLPPTTIGVRKKSDPRFGVPDGTSDSGTTDGETDGGESQENDDDDDLAATQSKALRTLVGDQSVVIAGDAARTLCIEFSASSDVTALQACVVRKRTGASTSAPVNGTCRIIGTSNASGPRSYDLECTSSSGEACITGESAGAIASLESSIDFAAIAATGAALDGYVVTDEADAKVTMTLHAADDYCTADAW